MFKFYKKLDFESSIDHKHKDWSSDNLYSYRQWYSEDIEDREVLLITIGDSWTWGDHLGCIDWEKASDDPIRLTQVFGRRLADKMDADWVNLARPGCSNYWMIEQLGAIEQYLYTYKEVHVVITLTEDLREATYNRVVDLIPQYTNFWNNSSSLKDFLIQVERYLFDNLMAIFNNHRSINWYVSRAFTDSWAQNTSSMLLDKTWCDVIQDQIKFDNYQKPVPFIGQMSITPLTDKFIRDNTDRKIEFLDIMERVGTRWNFLGTSEYNLKGSTCHPNPAGHQLWADYLFTKLNK
jgi:hypothetical protein